MMVSLLVMIYYAQVQPQKTPHANFVELVNEAILICVCYTLFILTDWVPEKEMQYELGWNFIYAVMAMILFNSYFVVKDMLYRLKLNVYK